MDFAASFEDGVFAGFEHGAVGGGGGQGLEFLVDGQEMHHEGGFGIRAVEGAGRSGHGLHPCEKRYQLPIYPKPRQPHQRNWLHPPLGERVQPNSLEVPSRVALLVWGNTLRVQPPPPENRVTPSVC